MIQIHIYPGKVEKVLFLASTIPEEDQDLAIWQVIRPLITKIDKQLRSIPQQTKNSHDESASWGTKRDLKRSGAPVEQPAGG